MGNPVGNVGNSFDCIGTKDKDIPIIYQRLMYGLASPFFFSIEIYLIYIILK